MMIHRNHILSLILMGCIFSSPLSVYAADHRNLEENHPTRIEDAYPIPIQEDRFAELAGNQGNIQQ